MEPLTGTEDPNEQERRERTADSAFGFACIQAIHSGRLDSCVHLISVAAQARTRLTHHELPPRRTAQMEHDGSVWAWMNGPDGGHWAVRWTGAQPPPDA